LLGGTEFEGAADLQGRGGGAGHSEGDEQEPGSDLQVLYDEQHQQQQQQQREQQHILLLLEQQQQQQHIQPKHGQQQQQQQWQYFQW